MSLFAAKPFDRAALLSQAEEARSSGKVGKAVKAYRRLLAEEPDDAVVHARLAPLLALRGEPDEAWHSFAIAADDLAKKGFLDKAVGLLRHAATVVPDEPALWHALGRLHLARDRRTEAVEALLEGRLKFTRRRERRFAIDLLLAVHAIEPWQAEVTIDLGEQLAAAGEHARAREILEGLVAHSSGRDRRRARFTLFALSPTPNNFGRWLRAVFTGR